MKTTIKAVRDGEETPLLELDGPFPTDRSKYGPGWFRYSFQLLEPGREARSGVDLFSLSKVTVGDRALA